MTSRQSNRARNESGDPVTRWLIVAIISVVVLVLTLGLWIVATGIFNPPAPRTYHERQIDLLEQVVRQKPKVARAWADWARALIAAKQYSAAERVISQGEKAVGKDTPDLNLERGRLLMARGKITEAETQLAKALKITQTLRAKELKRMEAMGIVPDPQTVASDVMEAITTLQGDLYASQKKWPEAVKAYTLALVEDPQAADTLVKRGAVYIELDEPKKAKADFQTALTYIPDFAPALTGLERLEKGTTK
jgi:tetratricopeptide (TPR) repeat protein